MLGQAANTPPVASTVSASNTPAHGTDGDRIRMLAELRTRYLQGTLDEVLFADDISVDRLLGDLLSWDDE